MEPKPNIPLQQSEDSTIGDRCNNLIDDGIIRRRKKLSADEVKARIRKTVDSLNKYNFIKNVPRNIVLIGRTRTGKSTIASVIKDPAEVPPILELFSQTRTIEYHNIAATLMHENITYSFTVIDTPGFYDQVLDEGKKFTNDDIKNSIDDCIRKEITNIHMFAFVFNLCNGINKEDIESMAYVKNNFPDLKDHMALIITRCEESQVEENNRLVDEFFKSPDVVKHGLADFFGLGWFFMGCLRPESLRSSNLDALADQIALVSEMRERFIDFCIKLDDKGYNIYDPMLDASSDIDDPDVQPLPAASENQTKQSNSRCNIL